MSGTGQRQLGQFFAITRQSSSTPPSAPPTIATIAPPTSIATTSNHPATTSTNPIQQYLRHYVSCDWMPRVSEKGIPFVAPDLSSKIGKDLAKNRIEFKSAKQLRIQLKKTVPNYPVHTPAPPAQRALQHRQGTFWTKESMRKAYDEFLVPADMKAIFICPEIFDRELLAGHTQFQCKGGLGVVSPCPKCGLQKYMRHAGWTTM
jgi:hypothetical protein